MLISGQGQHMYSYWRGNKIYTIGLNLSMKVFPKKVDEWTILTGLTIAWEMRSKCQWEIAFYLIISILSQQNIRKRKKCKIEIV